MSELNDLLDELETLAKAVPMGDESRGGAEKIKAAAEEGGTDLEDEDEDEDEDEGYEEPDEGEDEDEVMGKSIYARMPDGTMREAYDGTEMVKALLMSSEAHSASLAKSIAATTNAVRELHKSMRSQWNEIKKLRDDIARIGGEGRGRKTVLNVHAQPQPVDPGNQQSGLRGEALMAKAQQLCAAGILTPHDVATLDLCVGSPGDIQIPPEIAKKMARG